MTTRQHREATAAVVAWCKKHKIKLTAAVRHVHPRSYVVGYAAPLCLIVAKCWADSEPQLREFDKKYPLDVIHRFDGSLKPGDWCVSAYIITANASERVAVPPPEAAQPTGMLRHAC